MTATLNGQFDVTFIDGGREAKEKPDPQYPNGMVINLAAKHPTRPSCTRNVPYPAPRCGLYQIKCIKCGIVTAVSVAGRPDDPNAVTLPCKS